jgi:hypothetical protein
MAIVSMGHSKYGPQSEVADGRQGLAIVSIASLLRPLTMAILPTRSSRPRRLYLLWLHLPLYLLWPYSPPGHRGQEGSTYYGYTYHYTYYGHTPHQVIAAKKAADEAKKAAASGGGGAVPLPPGPPPGADFAPPLPSLPPPGLEAAAEGEGEGPGGGITGAKRSIDSVEAVDEAESKRSA